MPPIRILKMVIEDILTLAVIVLVLLAWTGALDNIPLP